MGLATAELWNNLGLCCFHASQYDMCLICFERALALSEDDNSADIWYNVGQLAIGIGDLGLAYQAFKIAVSVDMNHAESFNNLGVLELRKHNPEAARSTFEGSHKLSEFHFGPLVPVHTSLTASLRSDFAARCCRCARARVVLFCDVLLRRAVPVRYIQSHCSTLRCYHSSSAISSRALTKCPRPSRCIPTTTSHRCVLRPWGASLS